MPGDPEMPVMYNPVITKQYDSIKLSESCLSFPGMYLPNVPRYRYIELTFHNQDWEELNVVLGTNNFYFKTPLMCQATQHEVDHMDGILFWDRIPSKQKIRCMADADRNYRKYRLTNKKAVLVTGPEEICISKD